jgi:TonB-dependent SusC/RagA subfamily outer membrane receptor
MRKFLSLLLVLMAFSFAAMAQTRVITGQVRDAKGDPVPGASVKIKGGAKGTPADANGNFKIQVKSGDILVVSAANAETKEVAVGTSDVINIVIVSKQSQLSEVVVTALGVQRQAKEIGYATARVKTDELTQGKVTNLSSGLSGKVSGLDIRLTNNGVNPDVKITLRGNRSLTGNNTALIVVDGVPVPQSYIAALNPNDVENVTILKGANASALYGIEASNGVLIINTKKAPKGKLTLSLKNTTTFEKVSYLPSLQNEYGPFGGEGGGFPDPERGCTNCRTYIDPLTGFPLPVPFENQNFGPAYNSKDFPYSRFPISGPDANGKIIYGQYAPYKNGKKDFFQRGVSYQNELSGSVGNKWGGLYFSGQDVRTKGVVFKDEYRRSSARLNGNATFGRFTVNARSVARTASLLERYQSTCSPQSKRF